MAYSGVGLELMTRGDLPPEISSLAELEYLVRDQKKAFLYSTVAMLTLVLYDYIITLNMEVKFIWRSKDLISITNILFVLNRYYPIVRAACFVVFSLRPPNGPDADVQCANWTDYNSWSTMVNVATVEILMLSRTWALWGKSRAIGLVLLASWLCACVSVVGTVKSGLMSVPAVIGLAPLAVLPCDRPSPYKYMIVYCAALLLELISFLFMMSRIMHLIVKSKAHARGRMTRGPRSLALPLIRGIQWHGLSYFAAVIFIMAFTVYSSFNARLARAVVNAGVAPTITSIACNRVFFALRGLYFDVTVRGGEALNRTPAGSPQPSTFFSSIHAKLCPRKTRENAVQVQVMKKPKQVEENPTRDTETNYGYDNEIAVTRHDMETRDMSSSVDYRMHYRDHDEERGRAVTDRSVVNKEVQGVFKHRRLVFPGVRPPRSPGIPFHTHGTSSSTVLTSDDSARGASPVGEENALGISTRGMPGHGRGAGMGHANRGTSKSSFKFLAGPSSASPHAATGGKRSLSLSGIIRSPTREESGAGLDGTPEDIPMPTSPRTPGISERIGSIWRIKKDGREVAGSGYPDSIGNARSAGEEATLDRSRTREREREKEKHPLDHHYEMETIHSELIHDQEWSLGSVEDTEEDEYRVGRPRSGRIQGNVTRNGVGGLASERDLPGVITPHSSRSLERGLFYQE